MFVPLLMHSLFYLKKCYRENGNVMYKNGLVLLLSLGIMPLSTSIYGRGGVVHCV